VEDDKTPIICNGFKDDEFHRGGDPGDEDWQEHHPGGEKVQRAGADRQVRQAAQREAEHRRCA